MKGKVSIDYDNTLDRKDVQKFAEELISKGYEVWIVTSRCSYEYAKQNLDQYSVNRVDKANRKLFRVADNVGIRRSCIQFMNFEMKIEFIKDKDFLFHLDDDVDELMAIKVSGDSCIPFNVNYFEWKELIIKLLENAD